ncbi:vWA-MoxR associated conflict system protein [Streptomyces sp. NPDC003435]
MTGTRRRHVLVIGAQCASMPTLLRLEEAARDLHAVLTDASLGGCVPRSGEYESLVVSDSLAPEDVDKAVREAVRRAREDNAVLVLALLGHGFTTPQQTELRFMVADSTTGSPISAVDVSRLLAVAADESGVEGVIALIDTCYSAGGMPDAGQIAGGVRSGQTRLSVLTAAAADQPARGMRLTRALVAILREGLTGAGAKVRVDALLTGGLRERIVGQAVGRFEYDNDPFAQEDLWLARNVCFAPGATGGAVGQVGRQALEQAVTMWQADKNLPTPLTRSVLEELDDFVRQPEASGTGDRDWHGRVTQLISALLVCVRIVPLLESALASVMSTDLLREARRLAGLPSDAEGPELLRDLVEYAAVRAPRGDEHPLRAPARFVGALAHLSGSDTVAEQLRKWAVDHGVIAEFNDAVTGFERKRRQDGLRLVVSLAGALTGWPEEVDAWLVGTGERLPPYERFPCGTADRTGTGRAIGAALTWARALLTAPQRLENVDVAVPAHLLASWRPEEARIDRRLLGVHHDVVVRWSGRMDPDEGNSEMNDAARKALSRMTDCSAAPVEWIGAAVLGDRQVFEQELLTGRYDTVVGLDHHPDDLQDTLEQLLPYAPIILWPGHGSTPDRNWMRPLVRRHWLGLPQNLAPAYRKRWAREHGGCVACLGDVRSVWHDEAWLEFCRPFEQRIVTGPEEEL